MEETKHTKGPWEARVSRFHGVPPERQCVMIGTATETIAKMIGSEGCIDEVMPDASLMAASPDLYAKLVEIESAWCRSPQDPRQLTKAMDDVSELLNKLRYPAEVPCSLCGGSPDDPRHGSRFHGSEVAGQHEYERGA